MRQRLCREEAMLWSPRNRGLPPLLGDHDEFDIHISPFRWHPKQHLFSVVVASHVTSERPEFRSSGLVILMIRQPSTNRT